jgi:ABC-2 type transport system ATP-binding protein
VAIIEVRDLVKRYGDFTAVKGISFDVGEGEIFGIVGPNGAGKTTTLEIIETLKDPTSGSVIIDGYDVVKSPWEVKRRIGVQLQAAGFYPGLSLRELLELFAGLYDVKVDPMAMLRKVQLEDKAKSRYEKLSGGQKQRFSIASTLVNQPRVIFLDEPSTGLDPQARLNLWDLVREIQKDGVTVVLTTHYMEEAEHLCDRVAVVDHGHVIEVGSPQELVRRHFSEIAISFQAPDSAADYQTLAGASHAVGEDGKVTVYSNDAPRTMAALLERESASGGALRDLNVHSATLEDVFLKLTGRALRD